MKTNTCAIIFTRQDQAPRLPSWWKCAHRLTLSGGSGTVRIRERVNTVYLTQHVSTGHGHSSTTYKLKLNKGDIKATQGDTGHVQPDMVTQFYAHILDEDRKVNAQRFEAGFYSKPNLRGVEQSMRTQNVQQPGLDVAQLLLQLQGNPELASLLKGLLNANLFG